MRKSKILSGIAVLVATIFIVSTTAFAAPRGQCGYRDRQNAGEISSKEVENWTKLPEEKKQEIYQLENDILAAKKRVLEQYVKYGILSEEKATDMIQKLTNCQTCNQKEKKMPLFGRNYRR